MQVINREVFRWVFMALFLGLAAASLAIAVYGGIVVGGAPGALMMLAGLIYFIGCFGVTVFFNVPMNEALAGMNPVAGRHARLLDRHLPAALDLLEHRPDAGLRAVGGPSALWAVVDDPSAGSGASGRGPLKQQPQAEGCFGQDGHAVGRRKGG